MVSGDFYCKTCSQQMKAREKGGVPSHPFTLEVYHAGLGGPVRLSICPALPCPAPRVCARGTGHGARGMGHGRTMQVRGQVQKDYSGSLKTNDLTCCWSTI